MSDLNGKADPYVVLQLDGSEETQKTKVIEKTTNPVWNEEFNFDIPDISAATLLLTVMDQDNGEDVVVGNGQIQDLNSFKVNTELDQWVDLEYKTKLDTNVDAGKLHIKFTIVDPNQQNEENQQEGELPNTEEQAPEPPVVEEQQQQEQQEEPAQQQNEEAPNQTQEEQSQDGKATNQSGDKNQLRAKQIADDEEKNHIQFLKDRINAHHQRLAALINHSENIPTIKTKSAAKVPPSPRKDQKTPKASQPSSPRKETNNEEEQQNEQQDNEEDIQEEINVIQAKTRKSYKAILAKFSDLTSNDQTLDEQKKQRELDEGEHLEEMSVDKLSSIYTERKKESRQLDKDIAYLRKELGKFNK